MLMMDQRKMSEAVAKVKPSQESKQKVTPGSYQDNI